MSPHVFPEFRRHGVGRALMEASVAFAEELGIAHVATAVVPGRATPTGSWPASPSAPTPSLRVAPVHVVKSKLCAQRPPVTPHQRPSAAQVLAARRSPAQDPGADSLTRRSR